MVLCCGNFFSDDPTCDDNWKKLINKKPSGIVSLFSLFVFKTLCQYMVTYKSSIQMTLDHN